MIFYEKQCDIVWQGVNSIGHFLKKSISLARNNMKVWNLACNLGYVFTKRGEKKEIFHHTEKYAFSCIAYFYIKIEYFFMFDKSTMSKLFP